MSFVRMRTKKLSLVVVPLLLTACSQNNDILQQDVYNNQYNCQQDWHPDLCEQQPNSNASAKILFLGPQYYKTVRKVRYLGSIITRSGNNYKSYRPIISAAIHTGAKSTPVARRGFGKSDQINGSGGG
ncbi:hypothetical protein [Acinetobacter pollinis]|jgi:hypothetical protein|nr:hypothetical protein [Acinetobacter pollinis]